MKQSRPTTIADRATMKAAVRRACELAGGVSAATTNTRADAASLSRYGNLNEALFCPIDIAMDLDRLAGDDIILRAWANLRGYALLPGHVAPTRAPLTTSIGDAARKFGALTDTALDAAADGTLTPREGREILDAAHSVESDLIDIKRTAIGAMAEPRT